MINNKYINALFIFVSYAHKEEKNNKYKQYKDKLHSWFHIMKRRRGADYSIFQLTISISLAKMNKVAKEMNKVAKKS